MITAALVFGPGSLTVNTKLGASFGYLLLWVIVLSIIFMLSFTRMSSAIGCSTSDSLMQIIARRYGKWVAFCLGIGVFLISSSFQAGNSIGAGVAFYEMLGLSKAIWIVIISILAIIIIYARSFYKVLEVTMGILVLLMLASFLVTLILSKPNFGQMLSGLRPAIPSGSELLMVALVASSFSIVGAFYQSYLVQAKGWSTQDLPVAHAESIRSIGLLGFLSALVMICAASVLHQQQVDVRSAADLGLALEPLFGGFTSSLFMIGLFAASFSSLLGNATIGGSILADAFGMGHDLQSPKVKVMMVAVIIFGSSIAIIFGALPLQLIVFAQAITIIIAPAAAFFLILLANQREVMRERVYTFKKNILPIGGFLLLLVLAIFHLRRLIL